MGAQPCACQDENDVCGLPPEVPTFSASLVPGCVRKGEHAGHGPQCAADSLSEFQPRQAETPPVAAAEAEAEERGGPGAADGVFVFRAALAKGGAGGFGLAHVPAQPPAPGAAAALVVADFAPEGVAARWNEREALAGRPETALRRGDRIVSVDGCRDLERMRELVRNDSVQLTLERWPDPVLTRLCKGSEKDVYGMQMDVVRRSDGREALVVSQFAEDGLVAKWNRKAVSAGRVFEIVAPGSEVVRVGDHTSSARMQQALRSELLSTQVAFSRPALE